MVFFFFFFQAEDGIRDGHVTGVQTCALPISESMRAGITHVEIKSGYGLETDAERRLCEVAAGFTDDVTFMGAHVVPVEYEGRPNDYVELVCGEMLAACAPHAKWIDVFCEHGAFDAEQSRAV